MKVLKWWSIFGCALLFSCGEPLVAPALITESRVLGARVQAVDAPEEAWVAPGGRAEMRWLVAQPTGPAEVGWAFSLCVAETVSRGLPRCVGGPFAEVESDGASREAPQFTFTMPRVGQLGKATKISALGAFCAHGTPIVSEGGVNVKTTLCPDGSEVPRFAAVDVFAALDGRTNENPSLDDVTVSLEDEVWPNEQSAIADDGGCSGLGLLTVRAGSEQHSIRVSVPGGWSESLEPKSSQSKSAESLQLSHFVTGGELERAYSALEATETTSTIELDWSAPDSVDAGGKSVWFFLVARDGRGGTDWLSRRLCVLP